MCTFIPQDVLSTDIRGWLWVLYGSIAYVPLHHCAALLQRRIIEKESKITKIEEHHAKKIKFPFSQCYWIFDLRSNSQDTTIKKFTHQSFPSEPLLKRMLHYHTLQYRKATLLQRHIISTLYYRNAALSITTFLFELI